MKMAAVADGRRRAPPPAGGGRQRGGGRAAQRQGRHAPRPQPPPGARRADGGVGGRRGRPGHSLREGRPDPGRRRAGTGRTGRCRSAGRRGGDRPRSVHHRRGERPRQLPDHRPGPADPHAAPTGRARRRPPAHPGRQRRDPGQRGAHRPLRPGVVAVGRDEADPGSPLLTVTGGGGPSRAPGDRPRDAAGRRVGPGRGRPRVRGAGGRLLRDVADAGPGRARSS